MASLGAYIFCRCTELESLLDAVDACLEAWSTRLERTRKGRVWTAHAESRAFHVDLRSTGELLAEVGEQLLEAELLPEHAPWTLHLWCWGREPDAPSQIRALAARLADVTDGVATEVFD